MERCSLRRAELKIRPDPTRTLCCLGPMTEADRKVRHPTGTPRDGAVARRRGGVVAAGWGKLTAVRCH
ncbi:hypothetical protein NDU88_005459 [Pleurodeles waltl]|uniref:Uncharacterized protein n=1 Tax=Pleurodeles waltl TaxID=8319 RepID=A0AAV7VMU8_PLEWA|nr:hypothetical protein NDU88_005459 [Pleurodeles waltl]